MKNETLPRSCAAAVCYTTPLFADAVKAAGISIVSVGEAFLKTAEPGKVVEALLS